MKSVYCVIIGAGFAGASTAYHLSRKGAKDILLLEQERVPGVHSSGRNAAMVRQIVADPPVADLARKGALFLRNPPADWPGLLDFRQNGSLLLGKDEAWDRLCCDARLAQQNGVEAEIWSKEKAVSKVSVLKGGDFDGAIWCPTDGVVDIHALISGYLKGATASGAQVRYGTAIRKIEVRNGCAEGVVTSDGFVRAEVVVNAAGAWANQIAGMAGSNGLPLNPCRRHLFVTSPLPWVDPGWPFVWDLEHEMYFRPEAGGLLLCPCDQEPMGPGIPPLDEAVTDSLAEKVTRYFPELSEMPIKHRWAGLRTLSADGRFVVGWDPKVEGFFWVAGLGGHGVTTSSAVGSLAASLLMEEKEPNARSFSPARYF